MTQRLSPLSGAPRWAGLALAATLAALAAGCANVPRSRDLTNPAVSGATLAAQVCSNCHGLDGQAVSPNFPNLAAQPVDYLVAQLKGFRAQSRQDPAGFEYMWGLSRHLTDTQIQDLASHFAALTPGVQPIEGSAADIGAGQKVFESGVPERNVPACTSCHGPRGEGMATFPRLAGQHLDYVVKQLQVFQRTDQRPEGSLMKTVAHGLEPRDIRAVAAYVQALPTR